MRHILGLFMILPSTITAFNGQKPSSFRQTHTIASMSKNPFGLTGVATSALKQTYFEDEQEQEDSNADSSTAMSRRNLLLTTASTTAAAAFLAASPIVDIANAAPPMSIIAEELGYFPVTNKQGETVYIPKRVKRESSKQAIELAQYLKKSGAVMYGAYWCPHCARQKELFGKEAWDTVQYVECSPKGYGANANLCMSQDVDGYPTWVFPKNAEKDRVLSGEASLEALAKVSKFPGQFIDSLEENVPPLLGSNSCK